MAKFQFTLSIGLQGKHKEEIEIPDEELEGLDDEERNAAIDAQYNDWKANYIDGGWHEL